MPEISAGQMLGAALTIFAVYRGVRGLVRGLGAAVVAAVVKVRSLKGGGGLTEVPREPVP